jgi:hypothetical protein
MITEEAQKAMDKLLNEAFPEPKQETLEEAAKRYANKKGDIKTTELEDAIFKQGFIDGAKWKQERSYSKECMREAFNNGAWRWRMHSKVDIFKEWFEQFKKK